MRTTHRAKHACNTFRTYVRKRHRKTTCSEMTHSSNLFSTADGKGSESRFETPPYKSESFRKVPAFTQSLKLNGRGRRSLGGYISHSKVYVYSQSSLPTLRRVQYRDILHVPNVEHDVYFTVPFLSQTTFHLARLSRKYWEHQCFAMSELLFTLRTPSVHISQV